MFLANEHVETYKKQSIGRKSMQHNAYKKQDAYSTCNKGTGISGEKILQGQPDNRLPHAVFLISVYEK